MGKWSSKYNISDLPQNIIQIILTKLPIRDAVKTSILSTEWRYQWTTITQLVFDEKPGGPYDEQEIAETKLANFVTVSLLHDAPIHKFKVSSSYLRKSADIDQWLRVVSRKYIEQLLLGENWNCINKMHTPSHIFSCQQLTRLKLCKFVVKLPSNFQGFPCLKYLNLLHCTVGLEVTENLVSGCPLLEKFKFLNMDYLALSVRASNMKHLSLSGNFRDVVYLEHTPLLVSISIDFFKVWKDNIPMKVPVTNHYLKFIELEGINFEEMNAIFYALYLILQSPSLQELRISASSCGHNKAAGLDFWDKQCPADFTFKHLKVLKLSDVSKEHDIEFLKFVLGRSPVLEMISVSPPCESREQMNMVNEVLRLGKAYPDVDIKFLDP